MKNPLIIDAVIVLLAFGVWFFISMPPAVQTATDTGTQTTTDTPLATFTIAQVAEHNSQADCYTTIRDSVYDLTDWIGKHPGGERAILKICGKDGTEAFVGQHGGSPQQEKILEGFKIGTLAQ